MKKGLVLEGGGLRGLFTAGVIDVMMEQGITFDGLIGVSAGATFGCNYKSHQPGRVLRYNLANVHEPRYMGLRSWLRTGDLVGAEYSYHILPTQLDIFDFQTFRTDPMEFHVVCTDVDTGQPVYRRIDDMEGDGLDWMRASASMPIVSRPVALDGRRLLDGGIADSIPLRYFQRIGFQRNIVVLTQPQGFTKRRTRLMPIFHLTMHRYPAIIQAMSRRHLMYNDELDYLSQESRRGSILMIHPQDTLPIGRTEQNPQKMRHVYQMGRQAALDQLDTIRAFLDA